MSLEELKARADRGKKETLKLTLFDYIEIHVFWLTRFPSFFRHWFNWRRDYILFRKGLSKE